MREASAAARGKAKLPISPEGSVLNTAKGEMGDLAKSLAAQGDAGAQPRRLLAQHLIPDFRLLLVVLAVRALVHDGNRPLTLTQIVKLVLRDSLIIIEPLFLAHTV